MHSSSLPARVAATNKTITKYRNKPFDWDGETCLHLARTQLRNMGHRPPRIPRFYSALGAKRAMVKAGYPDMAAIFDSLGLARISPAAMLVGDIATLPGEDGFDAIVICAGGKLLGWHGSDLSRLQPIGEAMADVIAAWRV